MGLAIKQDKGQIMEKVEMTMDELIAFMNTKENQDFIVHVELPEVCYGQRKE